MSCKIFSSPATGGASLPHLEINQISLIDLANQNGHETQDPHQKRVCIGLENAHSHSIVSARSQQMKEPPFLFAIIHKCARAQQMHTAARTEHNTHSTLHTAQEHSDLVTLCMGQAT